MPAFAHGETDDKPNPVPRMSKMSESAAAAAAPANIAPQETALAFILGRFVSLLPRRVCVAFSANNASIVGIFILQT
jgi:hypothetical protein